MANSRSGKIGGREREREGEKEKERKTDRVGDINFCLSSSFIHLIKIIAVHENTFTITKELNSTINK